MCRWVKLLERDVKCEEWCNVGKVKYSMPKKQIEIYQRVLDYCSTLRFMFHSNAVKRTAFTVFGAVDGNSDEWIQYATDSIIEYFWICLWCQVVLECQIFTLNRRTHLEARC